MNRVVVITEQVRHLLIELIEVRLDDAHFLQRQLYLLILNTRQLERALAVFVNHYNGHRPHRSLELAALNGRPPTEKRTTRRSWW